jgi:hypothetical protein
MRPAITHSRSGQPTAETESQFDQVAEIIDWALRRVRA